MKDEYLLIALKSLINVGDEQTNTELKDLISKIENGESATIKLYPGPKGIINIVSIFEKK